ncbi:MAG: hypothetical protein JRH08_16685 [Deltaproteobacteria bacterium]|nr:hypothetical protein [Deltaproteobacteria bacterium]MBW1928072.1 hypothetical protein [Deltaproteobacteria bacterium]MBW2027180.1 hypothetical protein [Deltaproteobacteria bacterium]MBW2127252.1 hypothetical protein [Deltaproteobacteria bacterium]
MKEKDLQFEEGHYLARLNELKACLEKKANVKGLGNILRSIQKAGDTEAKLDHVAELEIGLYFSTIGEVEFEKKLKKATPHDIVLTFKGKKIVIEVKRIRKTERNNILVQEMPESGDLVEIRDKGEFGKLIRKIVDEKYPQLEDSYLNIICIVSKDIFFGAGNIQDAAKEIIRYGNERFYPDYVGSKYENLNALSHMNENTGEVRTFPVHGNGTITALIKELNRK